ncbi:MAG: hypothetical protein QM478_00875 [Flavobacteriaceae bacterium]
MNKLKTISTLLLIVFVFSQCTNENNFLIEKNRVGLISSTDKVSDIEMIFINDSVVSHLSEGALGDRKSKFNGDNDEYLIYSKEGKHLLTLVPKTSLDSSSTIKYVDVFDNQFKTDKELALTSQFKDVNMHYMINKVETTLSSATLYIDELNATITIDKKELGINPFSTDKVQLEQIPEMANLKSITIWFD